MSCATCQPIDCVDADELGAYSLQAGRFFTSPNYLFVLNCPPGYNCAGGGYYPNPVPSSGGTVTVPNSSISSNGSTLTTDYNNSLTCCGSVIPINFLAGTSMSTVEAGILSAFEQCAAARAACMNTGSPANGVHSPTPLSRNIAVTLDKATACNDTDYHGIITASGGTGPFAWGVISGSLPPGVAFSYPVSLTGDINVSRAAKLTGHPVGIGSYTFTVQCQDATGAIFRKTLTLGVIGFTNSPDAATVGTAYSFQFSAAGGTAPYTFSVPPGHLPSGLSISSTGLITGTPTEDIPTTFTVTLKDASGQSCGKQFTMTPSAAGCSTQIAGLTWTYDNDPSLIGPGFAMSAGAGTFSAAAPAPFSAFAECFCVITNNTAAPFTVRFKYVWSCLSTLGEITCYDAETATFIIDQTSPFTGTNQGDLVINPGETHHITLYVQTGSDAPASGTVLITCV